MLRPLWTASALALLTALGAPAAAAQDAPAPDAPAAAPELVEQDELPGYYQFYKRTGDQAELEAERTFAEAMAAGEYAPEHPDTPLPELKLPTPTGSDLRIRRNLGKRNTLLVTFRSWW